MIYALYKVVADLREKEDLSNILIDYIDADSCPPKDHFKAAAIGITVQGFDVLQATNVAGNPLNSMAATMNALDHMAWDGWKYAHQSSGKTPFWVLGKGLFYKASDLVELGGFNPWVTIEDPEVGMRFHKNGKRLGIIEGALIEEVPDTFRKSVIQRKRWVAGFWQSLTSPLTAMGYTFKEKLLAWLIFVPCLSLQFSAVYAFISAWQTYRFIRELAIFREGGLSGSAQPRVPRHLVKPPLRQYLEAHSPCPRQFLAQGLVHGAHQPTVHPAVVAVLDGTAHDRFLDVPDGQGFDLAADGKAGQAPRPGSR